MGVLLRVMSGSIVTTHGSVEQMREQEQRLLSEGYERVPAVKPDNELLEMQYKWQEEAAPISSLFQKTVALTWRGRASSGS